MAAQALSVCLFGCLGFLWARGTQELLECGCVSVLAWAVSLICSFNLRVALQQREPNFSPSSSWPPTKFVAPSLLTALPLLTPFPSRWFSSWVKGEAGEGGGRSAAEASQRAHSGHCVRARNNIYRSPLWAPWKQSQY